MKKGKFYICFALVVWAICLISMCFIKSNFFNTILFFGGFLTTVCICSFGCEYIEKENLNTESDKKLS